MNGDLHRVFTKDNVVIEVLETVEVDDAVIAACSNLHDSGFTIALDDFAPGAGSERLMPFAKIIKVDLRITPRPELEALLRAHMSADLVFLAEKVETREEFEWTREAGFDLFQGHFFEKPEVLTGKRITTAKVHCLELLREISSAEIDCKKTAAVIVRDVGLSYKLLRYANSAMFGLRHAVSSIEHAVVMLGSSGLRQWAAVAAIPTLASDKPGELAVKALVRAQFCERLARLCGLPEDGGAFMIGLFSHLDAMLDLPIGEALSRVHLSDDLAAVLLESHPGGSTLADIFQIIRDSERADWEAVMSIASRLGLTAANITTAYTESTFWTAQAAQWTSRKNDTRSKRRRAMGGNLQVMWHAGEGASRQVRVALQNISETGIQLRSKDKLPVRATVTCNDVKTRISGRGVVRYSQFSKGSYVIGVEFSGGTGWRDPLNPQKQVSHS